MPAATDHGLKSPKPRKNFYDFLCSWYSLGFAALIVLAFFIWQGILTPTKLEAGTFKMDFAQQAEQLNIVNSEAFRGLRNINEKELKIFLVMGGEDAAYYVFQDRSMNGNALHQIYLNLQADSLMVIKSGNDHTDTVYPTEQGKKVHRALIRSLYYQLSRQ